MEIYVISAGNHYWRETRYKTTSNTACFTKGNKNYFRPITDIGEIAKTAFVTLQFRRYQQSSRDLQYRLMTNSLGKVCHKSVRFLNFTSIFKLFLFTQTGTPPTCDLSYFLAPL
jgi:hypothetical protein